MHLCASELALLREELEPALQLEQLRALKLAREPRGADLRPDLEVLGDRPVRLLPALALRELDQRGAVKHPDMEVQVPRVDREARRQLAIRERLARLAEHLEHLQP